MISTLRSRIRKYKIYCLPWRMWKGEIDYLPISSKTLFARYGLDIDIVEKELKTEGFLRADEILLEVLKNVKNLKRTLEMQSGDETELNIKYGLIPDDWTEEDFKYFNREVL